MVAAAKRALTSGRNVATLLHYSATELLAAGVELRTVAGRLGHGSTPSRPAPPTRDGSGRPDRVEGPSEAGRTKGSVGSARRGRSLVMDG